MNVDDLPPDYDISKALIPEAVTVFESVTRRPPLPHRLYHYTSADGLLGIMRTEALWATSARYMNDASEVTYGQQIVCDTVKSAAKKETGIAREWLDRFVDVIPRVHDAHETYIASFCETPDMLSQWRAYGAGRGFCLVFRARKLAELVGINLFRVEYDRATQENAVLNTIRVHLEAFKSAVAANEKDRISPISGGLSLFLTLWVTAFKHPSFAEEREWRMMALVPFQVKIRSDRGWLRPYVEIALNPGDEGMPLEAITHGPSPNPELEKRALRLLLAETAYSQVPIEGSDVPLRV